MNIASRAGRWSAAHWKTATLAWVAMVFAAVVAGSLVGTIKLTDSEQSTGQSARAQLWLNQSGFRDQASEAVLIDGHGLTAASPEFRSRDQDGGGQAQTVAADRFPAVATGRRQPGADLQRRRSALIEFDMRGDADTAADRVQPVLDVVATLQRAAPHFTVAEFGDASSEREQNATSTTVSQGRDAVGPDHLPRPPGGVRRVRRRRPAGAARLLGGDGLGRPGRGGEPSVPRLRRDQLGDAADGDGRRGRLSSSTSSASGRSGGGAR